MAHPTDQDWHNYLRVSCVVETQLSPIALDASYSDQSAVLYELPEAPPAGFTVEGYAYLLCRCRTLGGGGAACFLVRPRRAGAEADGDPAVDFGGLGGGDLSPVVIEAMKQRRLELQTQLRSLGISDAEWRSYLSFFVGGPDLGPDELIEVPPEFRFHGEPPVPPLPYLTLTRVRNGIPVPPRYDVDRYPFRYGEAAAEVQGNVLAAFAKPHQQVLCLRFAGAAQARAWLRDTLPFIATTGQVAAWNARRRYLAWEAAQRAGRPARQGELVTRPDDLGVAWTSLSLSHTGLQQLAPDWQFDPKQHGAFVEGVEARAAKLGDTDHSSPGNWFVGGDRPVDAVLICAADTPKLLDARVAALGALFTRDGVERVELVDKELRGEREPNDTLVLFGDGTSQPSVRGFDGPLTDDPQATPPANPPVWDTELVPAGEFILGYPAATPSASGAAIPDWQRNGSFHVFRILRVDENDQQGLLEKLAPALGLGIGPVAEAEAKARLFGRRPDGIPLATLPDGSQAKSATNDFTFAGDDQGKVTPLFAHIRKQNPRLTRSDTRHRLLRRGIPYRRANDDRGIHFHAYMANIEDQFEYQQIKRANVAGTESGGQSGPDALVGTTGEAKPQLQAVNQAGQITPVAYARFVYTMGAVYAFVPSLSALKQLANRPDAPAT